MRFVLAVLVSSAVVLTDTGAQDRSPTPKSAQNLARALLPQAEWNEVLNRYAASLAEQLSASLVSSGEAVPDDLNAAIRKQLGDRLPYEQTLERHAEALAGHFTSEEMSTAADFYSSKLGKKVLAELPAAQEEVGEFLQGRLGAALPDIVKQVAPEVLERAEPSPDSEQSRGKRTPQAREPPAPSGNRP